MIIIETNQRHILYWHVGERKPHVNASHIEMIQADGDELNHVVNLFIYNERVTIPVSTEPVQRWYGDIAKSIFVAL